jgi:hypothetical protein
VENEEKEASVAFGFHLRGGDLVCVQERESEVGLEFIEGFSAEGGMAGGTYAVASGTHWRGDGGGREA